MVFSSPVFLFLFLPLFLGIYYLIPFRTRSLWILVGSYVFYGWWRPDFLLLIAASTAWTWALGARIGTLRASGANAPAGRVALAAGVVLNLGILGFFKYFNFGVEIVNDLRGAFGLQPVALARIILPIGISFYVFQAVSYLVDVYRGDARAARSLLDVGAFISLFPQLIAGPILRYRLLDDQLRRRTHSWDRFASGAMRFAIGFARKVLIADAVAPLADAAFAASAPGLLAAWVGLLAYSVQLYFDFTGYSDMAIGLGRMLGFHFPENFRFPYISRSITEFWRRWHISLSSWLREYLYIPLGGNRRGAGRTYVNLMTVMVLGGLWHGASWNFVLWGSLRGIALAGERALGKRIPGRVITLGIVLLGWVFFRAETLPAAAQMLASLLGADGAGLVGSSVDWQFSRSALLSLAIGLLLIPFEPRLTRLLSLRWIAPLLLILAAARMVAAEFSPFLYFQF